MQSSPAGHVLSYLPVPSAVPRRGPSAPRLMKTHTNVNPSAFTSRARPRGAVSDTAPDRPALDVGAFWLLLPGLCWEDPIQRGLIGNINTFITDMRIGEGKRGNVVPLDAKIGK